MMRAKESRRKNRLRRFTWIIVFVLIVAGGAGSWWWTHPSVFDSGYGTFGIDPRPVARATSVMGLPGLEKDNVHETIVLTAVRVHFSRNTADASASLSICRRRPSIGGRIFGTGTAKELHPYCRSLAHARDGTHMRLDHLKGDYFILTIHPTKAGAATVSGIDVSYRRDGAHFFQRGTQHIDDATIFTIKAT